MGTPSFDTADMGVPKVRESNSGGRHRGLMWGGGGHLPLCFFFTGSVIGSSFLSVVAHSLIHLPTSLRDLTLLPFSGFPQPQHPLPSSQW